MPTTRPAGSRAAGSPRRDRILEVAARLFARRGFHGVSIDEIGAAVGISGPALYRHFRGKEAMLGELLVGISERLLAGGQERAATTDPCDALDALLRFHAAFALRDRDLIILQDRDFASLAEADRRRVRRLQREYVEIWVAALGRVHPVLATESVQPRARAAVHAVFGLLNSTPYSAAARRTQPPPEPEELAELLRTMAHGAFAAAAAAATTPEATAGPTITHTIPPTRRTAPARTAPSVDASRRIDAS